MCSCGINTAFGAHVWQLLTTKIKQRAGCCACRCERYCLVPVISAGPAVCGWGLLCCTAAGQAAGACACLWVCAAHQLHTAACVSACEFVLFPSYLNQPVSQLLGIPCWLMWHVGQLRALSDLSRMCAGAGADLHPKWFLSACSRIGGPGTHSIVLCSSAKLVLGRVGVSDRRGR